MGDEDALRADPFVLCALVLSFLLFRVDVYKKTTKKHRPHFTHILFLHHVLELQLVFNLVKDDDGLHVVRTGEQHESFRGFNAPLGRIDQGAGVPLQRLKAARDVDQAPEPRGRAFRVFAQQQVEHAGIEALCQYG